MSLKYCYGSKGRLDSGKTSLGWSLCVPWNDNCGVAHKTLISMHDHSCKKYIETDRDLVSSADFVKQN